jgi:hypothetical protein
MKNLSPTECIEICKLIKPNLTWVWNDHFNMDDPPFYAINGIGNLDELYSYVYNIQPNLPSDIDLQNDPVLVGYRDEIRDMSVGDINKFVKAEVDITKFKKLIGKEELSIDDKRFIYFYKNKFNSKSKICKYLEALYKSQGLITKPPIIKKIQKAEPKKPGRPGRPGKSAVAQKPGKKSKEDKPVIRQSPKQAQQQDPYDALWD